MNRITICKSIIQSIKDYITNPDNLEVHREKNHFIRKRSLSMLHVILYLLYSTKASMFQNIAGIMDDLEALKFPNVSKQALSKARQYIHPDLFKELFYLSVDWFYKNIPSRKLWNGYHLFAIDGSKFELPNSKSNFEFFGELSGYPNPDRRFTLGLASMIYDVLDDYIVHASFHKYLASERDAALEHLQNLVDLDICDNSVVIFDRGYYSEKMFRYCCNKEQLCVMRLKKSFKISKNFKGDTITLLPANQKEGTDDIKIRVIEVTLDDGSKEYLATNLFDTNITADMFRELYFYRWPIETKYKELKSYFAIEEFNGATKTSVFQEFYINMLLSNLVSLIKNEADTKIETDTKSSNKHRYQANRSFIIGRMKKVLPKILCSISPISIMDDLLQTAIRNRSTVIDDRKYKRKRTKKGRTHFRNKKSSI